MFGPYGKGVAKGLKVTLTNLLRKPVTYQWPEERVTPSKRIRGVSLVWDKDRCTGCATCAKSCPQGNINIRTSRGDDNNYVVEQFTLDTGRCIFCGLCVESCPYEALFFSREYETTEYDRLKLWLNIDKLTRTAETLPSGYYRPEVESQLPEQTFTLDRRHKGFNLKWWHLTED
jgi:NAD(P)H-quinone oxidoreductase subunit I